MMDPGMVVSLAWSVFGGRFAIAYVQITRQVQSGRYGK
jgi:hypothetical protein